MITTKHVISAAHCQSPLLKFVRLAEHDTRTQTDTKHEDVKVTRFVPHKEYDGLIHDILMLYLERDVTFTASIRPICLPINEPLRSSVFTNANPFVAGWGLTIEGGKEQSPVLLQLQVPVVSNKDCREFYRKNGDDATPIQFGERILCAGGTAGKSTCTGDSGGPLMIPIQENGKFPFYQIGLISYAEGCARKNLPTVYTSVSYHIDWIQKKLKE